MGGNTAVSVGFCPARTGARQDYFVTKVTATVVVSERYSRMNSSMVLFCNSCGLYKLSRAILWAATLFLCYLKIKCQL